MPGWLAGRGASEGERDSKDGERRNHSQGRRAMAASVWELERSGDGDGASTWMQQNGTLPGRGRQTLTSCRRRSRHDERRLHDSCIRLRPTTANRRRQALAVAALQAPVSRCRCVAVSLCRRHVGPPRIQFPPFGRAKSFTPTRPTSSAHQLQQRPPLPAAASPRALTVRHRVGPPCTLTMASRAAPWRSLFETHLRSMASPQFVLSTLAAAAPGAATPYAPRARYCIFRGFWAELPDDARNPAPRNPRAYASDCMTFTTDVRMDKLAHIFGLGTRAEDMEPKDPRASGGGGPVEAVWWAEGPGTQWRVRGRAYVVADDIDDPAAQAAAGPSAVKRELASRMRVADEDKTRDWSWSRELTVAFGNQSPGIRGEPSPLAAPSHSPLTVMSVRVFPRPASRPASFATVRLKEPASRRKGHGPPRPHRPRQFPPRRHRARRGRANESQ